MSDKVVTYTLENGIAIVTIDNPPMNALTNELRAGLMATALSPTSESFRIMLSISAKRETMLLVRTAFLIRDPLSMVT